MLKTEDLKTVKLKSDNLKYCFMCWEPHFIRVRDKNYACVYSQSLIQNAQHIMTCDLWPV